jgi:mRNA interferase RelE/StbE
MSSSTLSDFPDNLFFLEAARKDFLSLEGHQRRLVSKALCKIALAPNQLGKPLGKQANRGLTGFRSTAADKRGLRIVWIASDTGKAEIAVIVVVGPRTDSEVYAIAARRRAAALDLEKIARDMLQDRRQTT